VVGNGIAALGHFAETVVMGQDKKKIRTEFRKNRIPKKRQPDITRDYERHTEEFDDIVREERVTGKGEMTRKRTVIGSTTQSDAGFEVHLEVDESVCLAGRVLSVYGLTSLVQVADGRQFHCATRRILKTLTTDLRQVVVAGDHVMFRPEPHGEGIIERVEPRHGVLSRTSRGRQHVIATNVDQMLIVASAAQPDLKPNLIDRFLLNAEKSRIRPILCITKVDLVDPADLQPLIGVYGQMGYLVIMLAIPEGRGVDRVRDLLAHRESVVVGQSGVGKSSLLNAVDPTLQLRVNEVSEENEKGKHTTTTAQLIPLQNGGFVVDTPGIRQFELWDVVPEEVACFFRDLRSYVSLCRFPNCTHTHESHCAVKDAVADGRIDARRYESYCHLCSGE
jgi:ribosome biogenesis GTPase